MSPLVGSGAGTPEGGVGGVGVVAEDRGAEKFFQLCEGGGVASSGGNFGRQGGGGWHGVRVREFSPEPGDHYSVRYLFGGLKMLRPACRDIVSQAAEAVGLKTEENEFVSILEVDFPVEGGPGFLDRAD